MTSLNEQSCWTTTALTTTATPSAACVTQPIVTPKMHKSLFVITNNGPFVNDVMQILPFSDLWLSLSCTYAFCFCVNPSLRDVIYEWHPNSLRRGKIKRSPFLWKDNIFQNQFLSRLIPKLFFNYY